MSVTLSWLLPGYDDPKDSRSWHEETFVHERDATLRAIELYATPRGVLGSGIYLDGTLVYEAEFAARLELIERRREAVALELMTLAASGNSAWAASHPDPGSRRTYWDAHPESARQRYLDRADRLIAAYEGALQ